MSVALFHWDNEAYFDIADLRSRASRLVRGLSLIRHAAAGHKEAAIALKIGFWPFVREFELAIDQQLLPRAPLVRKFGDAGVRGTFTGIARAVRDMKDEEGSHAAHWRKDAECLGIDDLGDYRVSGVQALIDRAYTRDLPRFFAMLAGTEFIAEELARFLVESEDFTDLFSRKRWLWGEVHLAAQHDGPSHLEIDLDLARAYSTNAEARELEDMIIDTIELFGKASDDVEEALLLQT